MKLNEASIELNKKYEGLELKAYLDPVGIWTIGYGHSERAALPPKVKPGMVITEKEADRILIQDMEHSMNKALKYIKVPLNENQIGAITVFVHNVGIGNFASSTFLKRINQKDWAGAVEALQWFNKGTVNGRKIVLPGLVRRRKEEGELFMKPVTTKRSATNTGNFWSKLGELIASLLAKFR